MSLFRAKRGQRGFTMMELMVVVVIVGVLAAVAVPLYGKYIKNARMTEATGRIGEIVTAAKAYAQEHQNEDGDPVWPPAKGGGLVDLSATENFKYSITAGGEKTATDNAFSVTAEGQNKMDGVKVVVTVPDINSNGNPPTVTGL
ncbi:MAG: prepilin-type N-terminal cleavage/methylation domain-containing protein [Candidatus Eisenbacteria bacterium]|nr:prepilin-type N-terminal cleavage/methylation domain-containing protein [Candidatus Eisenbacteria bacterium]